MVAIVELILGIIGIVVGFFIIMAGFIVIEILYYVNGIELAEWQEWAMVLLMPYILFRILYFFIARFKRATAY